MAAGQPTPHHAHGVPHEPVDFDVSTGPPAQTFRDAPLVRRGLRDLQRKEFILKKTIYNKFRELTGGLNFNVVPPKMRRVSERRRFPIKSVIPNVSVAVVAQASSVNLL